MIHKKLLNGTLSLVVLASSLSAQGDCPSCRVDLKKLNVKTTREVHVKSEVKTHYYAVPSDYYEIVDDGKVTVIFPSYVMTEAEKRAYVQEQKAIELNKKANAVANKELKIVIKPIEKIEDKILNKNLPTSEYFCDNDKKPVLIKGSDLYECVIS